MECGPRPDSKAKFENDFRSALGEYAAVCCVEARATVDLRDIGELTTVEEATA